MIPKQGEELTAAWLTEALRRAGALDTQRVARTAVTRIGADSGFASRIYRLRIAYDSPAPDAPTRIVVKLDAGAPPDATRNALLRRWGEREVGFYQDLAPRCAPWVPTCLFAGQDSGSGRYMLLLEDLAGAELGDAERGCRPQQAAAAIDTLAALHA